MENCALFVQARVFHRPPTGALWFGGTAPLDGPWKTLLARAELFSGT